MTEKRARGYNLVKSRNVVEAMSQTVAEYGLLRDRNLRRSSKASDAKR